MNSTDPTEIVNFSHSNNQIDTALVSAIVEQLVEPIYAKDSNRRYVFANDAYLEKYGFSRDQMIGSTDSELFAETTACDESDIKLLTDGQDHAIETTIQIEGKKSRDVLVHKRLGRGLNSEKLIIGQIIDITVKKEKERQLLSVINNIEHGILFLDDSMYVHHISNRFYEMFGINPQIINEGSTFREIMGASSDEKDRVFGTISEREHMIREGSYGPILLERSDGRVFSHSHVQVDDTRLLIYSDITKQKEHESELNKAITIAKSAERAKSEFLANMSHEIRTPMNGVMGMAELLSTTELDAKQSMFTDVIIRSGESLLTIINDILDFSKIDAGQMELDPAPFKLAEAIEDVATLVSAKVAEKDLELIVRVDPKLPKLMVGDVGRIRQIVTNLIGNAVKFTEKGHVYVNVEGNVIKDNEGDFTDLKLSVEDTGIGIPQHQCDKVFQKFSQVDTSATRKHEGTGLGLSIASSLVKLMNGEIGVESTVGQGSTFWFTAKLPVHGEIEEERVIPGDLSGANILIVDDNAVNRSILTEQMKTWGFDSVAINSGKQALQVMRRALESSITLDLVVLDYQMPDMDGAEVLRQMHKDPSLHQIPVVMLSSVDSAQTNQELTRLGAEANLTKPTRSSLLLETILQVIANNRAKEISQVNLVNAEGKCPSNEKLDHDGEQQSSQFETIKQPNVSPFENQEQIDILVAEDNEVNQIVISQILENTDLSFKLVENGRLVLDLYRSQPPRLILMDVSMPVMNGNMATVAIRDHETKNGIKKTPIIGVTAHALKGDMQACLDAGMDDYLSKPVSPKALIDKIKVWIDGDISIHQQ